VGQRRKTGRWGGLRLKKKEGRERREGGVWEGVFFFLFFSNSFLKLSKVLSSFKTFHLLNSFPKISNQFKNS
jgi:hypothetical protein